MNSSGIENFQECSFKSTFGFIIQLQILSRPVTNSYAPPTTPLTLDTSHYLCIITFDKICRLLIHTIWTEESYRGLAPEREPGKISISSGNLGILHTFLHTRTGPRAWNPSCWSFPCLAASIQQFSKQVSTRLGWLSDIVDLAWQTHMQDWFLHECAKTVILKSFHFGVQGLHAKNHRH